jgi:hypothetical protein
MIPEMNVSTTIAARCIAQLVGGLACFNHGDCKFWSGDCGQLKIHWVPLPAAYAGFSTLKKSKKSQAPSALLTM